LLLKKNCTCLPQQIQIVDEVQIGADAGNQEVQILMTKVPFTSPTLDKFTASAPERTQTVA
jgi:hypothetical protein